jgi:hypothetical protein
VPLALSPLSNFVLSIQRKGFRRLRIGRILTIRIGGNLDYNTKPSAS